MHYQSMLKAIALIKKIVNFKNMKVLQVKKYNQLERQKLDRAIEQWEKDINPFKTFPNGVFYGFRDEKTYNFKQKGWVCMCENGARLFKNKKLAIDYSKTI